MAVAQIVTDSWLTHLEFVGGQRQTDFGPIDGLFFGLLGVTGTASGGNVTLNGNISFEKKEDWIYILQKVSGSRNDAITGEQAFIVAATGPLIGQVGSGLSNPSFHIAGTMQEVVNNAVTIFQRSDGSETPFRDLPVFGDKRITGPLALIAMGFENNTNGVVYQLSVYGWLIRYSTFFRMATPG